MLDSQDPHHPHSLSWGLVHSTVVSPLSPRISVSAFSLLRRHLEQGAHKAVPSASVVTPPARRISDPVVLSKIAQRLQQHSKIATTAVKTLPITGENIREKVAFFESPPEKRSLEAPHWPHHVPHAPLCRPPASLLYPPTPSKTFLTQRLMQSKQHTSPRQVGMMQRERRVRTAQ